MGLEKLFKDYREKKSAIQKRLHEFEAVWSFPERKIFSELCFCICTPQSNAVQCDKAIKTLEENGDLYNGGLSDIRKGLRAVRFPNNKSRYIIQARGFFAKNGSFRIKELVDTRNIKETRLWFANNVKGLGLKEASHFLRNIGFGSDIAILDVHILRNMKKYGAIKEIPANLSQKVYVSIEERLRAFSGKVKIPMAELDLLFWSSATGKIFK